MIYFSYFSHCILAYMICEHFRAISPHEPGPMLLHGGMFVPTIMSQASEEQRDDLMAKIKAFQIIGTYAQTEMGHGNK